MRVLKRVVGVLLVLAALFCAIGFFLPAKTHVERSVVIARPPADVFAMLDSYRRFNTWSPWYARDPKAQYVYEGPAAGVGASMRWASEKRDVGSGRQTIIESVPNSKLVTKLEFDGQGDAIATFDLRADGDGTRVVWGFDTEHGHNPVSRWFGLALDRMVGPDFEQGLAKLKQSLESDRR